MGDEGQGRRLVGYQGHDSGAIGSARVDHRGAFGGWLAAIHGAMAHHRPCGNCVSRRGRGCRHVRGTGSGGQAGAVPTYIGGVIYGTTRRQAKVGTGGSFLPSAVAPSTSTRYPRKARPINWTQRGGLVSGAAIRNVTEPVSSTRSSLRTRSPSSGSLQPKSLGHLAFGQFNTNRHGPQYGRDRRRLHRCTHLVRTARRPMRPIHQPLEPSPHTGPTTSAASDATLPPSPQPARSITHR